MAKQSILSNFKPRGHDHRMCIADALAAAEALCRERGLRLTPLRRRVLELVWERHEPAGAYDLLAALRGDGRRADPPTVYRALDFLLQNGLVHRIESLNAYVGCGEPGEGHRGQFLICRTCHRVAELEDPAISALIVDKAETLGFRVRRQTIEVTGLCAACESDGMSVNE